MIMLFREIKEVNACDVLSIATQILLLLLTIINKALSIHTIMKKIEL